MSDKIIKDKNLLALYEKDKVFAILLLYYKYILDLEGIGGVRLSSSQFQSKNKALSKQNPKFKKLISVLDSYYDFEKYYRLSYEKEYNIKEADVKNYIINMIIDYFKKSSITDQYHDSLAKYLFENNIGKNLSLTPHLSSLCIEDGFNLESITFNLYDDVTNLLACILFELKGVEYKKTDDLLFKTDDEKFDTIFYVPPYRFPSHIQTIYKDRQLADINNKSFENVILNNLLKRLKPNGKIIAIISTGILNKIADYDYKKMLVEKNYLKMIIELPRLTTSIIPLSLAFFTLENKSDLLLINASKFAQNMRRGIDIDSDKIIEAIETDREDVVGHITKDYAKEIKYDLTPSKFFNQAQTDFINPTPIKDLTTAVFRGFQIPSDLLDEYASEKTTKYKLLTLSDIENGVVSKKNMQSLKGIHKSMEHYKLETNDLIINCKGSTFKTCVIEIPYNEVWISTGSILVIRCDEEKIDPRYLKIFLDSHIGVERLKNIQTGTSVLSLNPTKLLNILVPLIHLSKQMQIASSYEYKLKNIIESLETIEEMREKMKARFDTNFLNLINN